MADTPTQVRRTLEIEEVTNRYVIHPLSQACVRLFARWNVSPNAVSLLGLGLGATAAVCYYHYHAWPLTLLGFALMIGWHVMDGADGQLARLTGRTSEVGKALDGLCDHGTFTLVYLSLVLAILPRYGSGIWVLALFAGVSHVAQASAYEFQRQMYDYWGRGKASARPPAPQALRQSLDEAHGVSRLLGQLYLWYVRIQHRFSAVDRHLHAALHDALQEADDEAVIRAAYRHVQQPAVHRWGLLCSNYRTIVIFLACLAGWPIAFFLFEIVVLNIAFVLLIRMQHRRNQQLYDWLSARAIPNVSLRASGPVPG